MPSKETALGDPHNFGRRVSLLDSETVYKPRPLLWEWLFLSADSPLRNYLTRLFASENKANPFDLVPKLKFLDPAQLHKEGRVQRLKLDTMKPPLLSTELAEKVGALVALLSWMGVSDLHIANTVVGAKDRINFVAPLDIECLFSDLALPSQTHLLPSPHFPLNKSGLEPLINLYKSVDAGKYLPALAQGFAETYLICKLREQKINAILAKVPHVNETPIRVILKTTEEYRNCLQVGLPESDRQNFLPSEWEQLSRNDIPYYFRYFDSPKLYYWGAENSILEEPALLPSSFPSVSGSEKKLKMYKLGVLQIIRCFAPSHLEGEWAYHQMKVKLSSTKIQLIDSIEEMRLECVRH